MTRLRVKRIRRKHRWQFGISSNVWMDSFSIHWLHSEWLVWIDPKEEDQP